MYLPNDLDLSTTIQVSYLLYKKLCMIAILDVNKIWWEFLSALNAYREEFVDIGKNVLVKVTKD